MNDMKKLIKRDKFIWLLWSIAVAVFVGNMLFAFYKNVEAGFVQLYNWKAERPEIYELVSFLVKPKTLIVAISFVLSLMLITERL